MKEKVRALVLCGIGIVLGVVLSVLANELIVPDIMRVIAAHTSPTVVSLAGFVCGWLALSLCSVLGLYGMLIADRIEYGVWTAPPPPGS